MADVVIINKIGTAKKKDIETVLKNVKGVNPKAKIIKADLEVTVAEPKGLKNKKILIVEDGPTITHGEMSYGAGMIAAKRLGAKSIVEPRPYLVGSMKATFKKYPHIGKLLPAMGYGDKQINELQTIINKSNAEIVLTGTPIDLSRLIKLKSGKKFVRVKYEYKELSKPGLKQLLEKY
jgi:predicted GTPase